MKHKRPTLPTTLVTVRALMAVNAAWQKKINELEARLRVLEARETPT